MPEPDDDDDDDDDDDGGDVLNDLTVLSMLLNILLTRNAVINAPHWNVLSNYNCCSDFNRATLDLYNWLQLRAFKICQRDRLD